MEGNKQIKRKTPLQLQVKFLGRFTDLVENGFSIMDALEIVETIVDPKMVEVIKNGCNEGKLFSDILESLGFLNQIVYIIRASETHNALGRGLVRAKEFSHNYVVNKSEMAKKMRYPLFLFATVILVLSIVSIFFIPRLDEFYTTFGIENNQLAIDSIVIILLVVLFTFTTLVVSVLLILKNPNVNFQTKLRKYLFKIPVLKKLTSRLFSYYFASQIELFIGCGLSFKDSLATIQLFDTLPLVKLIAKEIEYDAQIGESIESLFLTKDCFTAYFRMIAMHALKIGKFDKELKLFVTTELTNLNAFITGLIKAFQSGLLALVGVLIALLYLSILQPVFDLITII